MCLCKESLVPFPSVLDAMWSTSPMAHTKPCLAFVQKLCILGAFPGHKSGIDTGICLLPLAGSAFLHRHCLISFSLECRALSLFLPFSLSPSPLPSCLVIFIAPRIVPTHSRQSLSIFGGNPQRTEHRSVRRDLSKGKSLLQIVARDRACWEKYLSLILLYTVFIYYL